MSWPLYLIKSIRMEGWREVSHGGSTATINRPLYTLADGSEKPLDDLPPGAMWTPAMQPPEIPTRGEVLSILLPDQSIFRLNPTIWTLNGTPPNVTIHPSINSHGRYHGWITNGVIGDDVEGRRYNEKGLQIH